MACMASRYLTSASACLVCRGYWTACIEMHIKKQGLLNVEEQSVSSQPQQWHILKLCIFCVCFQFRVHRRIAKTAHRSKALTQWMHSEMYYSPLSYFDSNVLQQYWIYYYIKIGEKLKKNCIIIMLFQIVFVALAISHLALNVACCVCTVSRQQCHFGHFKSGILEFWKFKN